MSSEICLVSASPRRSELLDQIGIRHRVMPVSIDESRRADEAPEVFAERVARDKALAGRVALTEAGDQPLLAADTAVVVEDHVLGKPAGRADGRRMLEMLSGRTHRVYTAVALHAGGRLASCTSCTEVSFRVIASWETASYWDTGEPRDKAGGYAIQGLGAVFVSGLSGSYSGVMGLPLFETSQLLAAAGIKVLAR
jgi:septum formation protein